MKKQTINNKNQKQQNSKISDTRPSKSDKKRQSNAHLPTKLSKTPSLESNHPIYDDDEENWLFDILEDVEDINSLKRSKLSNFLPQIRDYIEFKSARTIQRFVRGWLVRRRCDKYKKAVIIIQSEWRRFYYQRQFFKNLENLVQKNIEDYYYDAATKIQSFFRGWWIREHIHDHTRLVQLQITAGEDLLHCVAFKLHHLLRTHQIPGIYSLRNTTALSKVEELLASITFKQCNYRARWTQIRRKGEIHQARKEFTESKYGTNLPYAGPNINNSCEAKCLPLYSVIDADNKMIKILTMFETASRKDNRILNIHKKKMTAKNFRHICLPPPTTFCSDVVRSMRRWNIITEHNLTILPNVLECSENLQKFLFDMRSWWDIMHGNCLCRKTFNEEVKRNTKLVGDGKLYYQNICSSKINNFLNM